MGTDNKRPVAKNTIELNGKRYDAATGELLADGPAAAPRQTARTIDGIISADRHAKPAAHKPVKTPAPRPAAVMDIRSRRKSGGKAAQALSAHRPQPAATLMRTVVHRPDLKPVRSSIKLSAPLKPPIPGRDGLSPPLARALAEIKLSVSRVDPERLARAKRIARSQLVSRYGNIRQPGVLQRSHANHVAATSTSHAAARTPISPGTGQRRRQPAAGQDIFTRALSQARSHEQVYQPPRAHKRHRRLSSAAAAGLTVLLLAGFIAYQNVPNITMRLASSRAGFHASLPAYQPSGFSVGHFAYSPGMVAVNYHSNSDNRQFSVTQKVSAWDSQALLNAVVATRDRPYQSYEQAGRTVYIYGNGTATWVSGGIWYTVTANGSLSTRQLLHLASSM